MNDDTSRLPDEHPLSCVNEQIKDLMRGWGATEDHEDVISFLAKTGLPDGTVRAIHLALINAAERLEPATQQPERAKEKNEIGV